MAATVDACYTIVSYEEGTEMTVNELRTQLEKGDTTAKIAAMKAMIVQMMSGEALSQLLMHVIRFVMPSKDKILKKLLLTYYEIVPKKNPDGKLKQEFILVCNALRNDLQHPNEYIRAAVLRFLCKLRETEILEPCVPAVRACLEHRHPHVKKSAVLAIMAIHKFNEALIPDAAQIVYEFLLREREMSTKRNAFLTLMNTDQELAVKYLVEVLDQIPTYSDSFQLLVVELVRKVCRQNPRDRAAFVKIVLVLLNSASNAVKYEAAATLMSITSAPSAVRSVAGCYINMVIKESDNNVKLIVLDRVRELIVRFPRLLDDQVMDLLRILASPDLSLRTKTLKIAMELVSSRTVADVASFLRKEITKTLDEDYEQAAEYRQRLVQTVHQCAIRFPAVAASVVQTLLEFVTDQSADSAADVITFVREVVERFPQLRGEITTRLIEVFGDIKHARVYRGVLWILAEYSITSTLTAVKASIGEVPIVASEQREAERRKAAEAQSGTEEDDASKKGPTVTSRVTVLADGTYATQTIVSETEKKNASAAANLNASRPPLRGYILDGDYYTAVSIASALTKLALRLSHLSTDQATVNGFIAESALILAAILRVGKSEFTLIRIDADSHERIALCLRALLEPSALTEHVFLESCRVAFGFVLASQDRETKAAEAGAAAVGGAGKENGAAANGTGPDDLIKFRLLRPKAMMDDGEDRYDADLTKATGTGEGADELVSKLSRIVQLTGHSDPIYAEAYVTVQQYDILLDVLVVNQTNETLQNVAMELATLGDLKLGERPATGTLAPRDFMNMRASIKVSSTETGVIFGNLVYETTHSSDGNVVVLNDVHIDIMDYIHPATCDQAQFRAMWAEFEWENKINVNTENTSLRSYLKHLMAKTNMACLTPEYALEGDCSFLAANLYARSSFGEDALANVSLEQGANGKITGLIRIRSKAQGIALSLGEKFSQSLGKTTIAA